MTWPRSVCRLMDLAPRAVLLVGIALALICAHGSVSGQTFELLHTFKNTGENPQTPLLLAADGNLYGTTVGGGTFVKGMVFRLVGNGAGGYTCEELHSFDGVGGMNARSGLIEASDGMLYGLTWRGGANDRGVAYRITTAGDFQALHSFSDTEGSFPAGELVQASDGTFYGTASTAGPTGGGVVFQMDLNGNVTVLHSFDGTEGFEPVAGLLLASDGFFYGTASKGGSGSYGTVFRADLQGNLTVLHAFSGVDGASPRGGLAEIGGNVFGTTSTGSVQGTSPTGFVIDPLGNFLTIQQLFDCRGVWALGSDCRLGRHSLRRG